MQNNLKLFTLKDINEFDDENKKVLIIDDINISKQKNISDILKSINSAVNYNILVSSEYSMESKNESEDKNETKYNFEKIEIKKIRKALGDEFKKSVDKVGILEKYLGHLYSKKTLETLVKILDEESASSFTSITRDLPDEKDLNESEENLDESVETEKTEDSSESEDSNESDKIMMMLKFEKYNFKKIVKLFNTALEIYNNYVNDIKYKYYFFNKFGGLDTRLNDLELLPKNGFVNINDWDENQLKIKIDDLKASSVCNLEFAMCDEKHEMCPSDSGYEIDELVENINQKHKTPKIVVDKEHSYVKHSYISIPLFEIGQEHADLYSHCIVRKELDRQKY